MAGLIVSTSGSAASPTSPWVGTWGVAPQTYSVNGSLTGKTLRQIVHTSTGGSAIRVALSNLYGNAPLTVSNIHVAVVTTDSGVDPATDRPISVGGLPSITLPAGASVVSDGVDFAVPTTGDVAVSFYVSSAPTALTGHSFSQQDRFVADGNVSGQATISAQRAPDYLFLTRVDVQHDTAIGTLVAIGASITDGYASSYGSNHRWPNRLATRLQAAGTDVGVVNEGISGNNLFTDASGDSGLKRFDRDVLSQPGVRWVIFSDDPINDLDSGNPQATAPGIIAALQSLIASAHDKGVLFACSTLTPFEGSSGWTSARESVRGTVNTWIRSAQSTCDAVVDQDLATHDPARPTAYLPAYDAGDHLHPNDAGYVAIANAVDLTFFKPAVLSPIVAPVGCGSFAPGDGLRPGQTLKSCDGRFTLNLQMDGNLVLYKGQATVLASTGTVNTDAAQLELTKTGDFLLYGKLGEMLWRSGNAGQRSAHAYLQDDGNLVIYGDTGPVWATNTSGQ